MNPLLLILALGLGIYVVQGAKIASAVERSTIKVLSLDSFKVVGSEFVLTATIAIDNPTNIPLNVKQPNLRLLFNTSEIANSVPSEKINVIKANGRTTIPNLNLRMSIISVPAIAISVLNNKQNGQAVILETSTIINGIAVKDSKPFLIADLVTLAKKI